LSISKRIRKSEKIMRKNLRLTYKQAILKGLGSDIEKISNILAKNPKFGLR
jgi:hypothetical protein